VHLLYRKVKEDENRDKTSQKDWVQEELRENSGEERMNELLLRRENWDWSNFDRGSVKKGNISAKRED